MIKERVSSIPKDVYMSIPDKSILEIEDNKITISICKNKENLPSYKFHIYDDFESREFVKDFGDPILTICYDEILPGAYKCDIFRLVALYRFGGIYIDAGILIEADNLESIMSENDLILCRDKIGNGFPDYGIYNAFMASVKDHPFIKFLIESIISSITKFNYGSNILDIAGPNAIGKLYNDFFGSCCEIGNQYDKVYILRLDEDLAINDAEENKITHPKERAFLGKAVIIDDYCNHYSYLWCIKKVFFQLVYSSWHLSATDYRINKDGFLCAKLKDFKGDWVDSKIKYEPNTIYSNINGVFCKELS